ncbi:transposase [Streptomyces sp.]|uniref:transposase n=1 Tax=Streptomyces sp. TaxID=1931 RepID=UPI0039C9AD10
MVLEGVDLYGTALKYSPEFRSDAIALWRASAGRRTFKDVAANLNVNPETLRMWVRDADGSARSARASAANCARRRSWPWASRWPPN